MIFNIQRKLNIPNFEYFYFLVMIIYCAKMTPETAKMENFGGAIIPFSVPIILTAVLLHRNHVYSDILKLAKLCLILFLWSVVSIIHVGSYNYDDFTLYLFLLYSVVIAYIHIGVFGDKIFPLYEDIMVKISLLSIILWFPFCLLFPDLGRSVFSNFPRSYTGFNFLYLFNWTGLQETGRFRNSGCAWEQGFFALMIAIAMFFNLRENGLKIRGNKNLWILIIAMITTTSTTGYVVMFVEFLLFYMKQFSIKSIICAIIIFFPIIFYGSKLSFIGEKITDSIENTIDYTSLTDHFTWGEEHSDGKIAIDRIPTLVIQTENFIHDPIIGYGLNDYNSYFFKTNNITNMAYCGGCMQIFSQFGLLIGLFIYSILIYTSKMINSYSTLHNFDFFIICLLLSVSYPLFRCPVLTAFWLFGYFYKPNLEPLECN